MLGQDQLELTHQNTHSKTAPFTSHSVVAFAWVDEKSA